MSKKNEYLIYRKVRLDSCDGFVNQFVCGVTVNTIDKRLEVTVEFTMMPEKALRVKYLDKCRKLCRYLDSEIPCTFFHERVCRAVKPNAYLFTSYRCDPRIHDCIYPTKYVAYMKKKIYGLEGIHPDVMPLYGYCSRVEYNVKVKPFTEISVIYD